MKVAIFGIHKLLSETLDVLEQKHLLPDVVVFPPIESAFHTEVLTLSKRKGIHILRPQSVKSLEFIEELKGYQPERIIVAGYHQIFPEALLQLASKGVINCHGGLLPQERGPIPWKWAIYHRKKVTGVTLHQMTDKIDSGDIYYKKQIELAPEETSESLFNKVAGAIAAAVPQFFMSERLEIIATEEIAASVSAYNGQVPAELCRFDLTLDAEELQSRVRAFSPRPGVFFEYEGRKLLIKKVKILLESEDVNGELVVRAADYRLVLKEYDFVF